MTPGTLLLLAAASLAAAIVCGPRFARMWLALTLVGAATSLSAALLVLAGAPDWQWRSGFLIGGETLHYRLDGLSALFLVLLSVVGGAGAVYAREYWSDEHHPASAPRGRAWWCGLVLSMGLVLVSSNGLHFLIAWELFTVCAFFLITLDRRQREVRAAGWLYLAASHAGTVCLFAFFGLLAARTGGLGTWPVARTRGVAIPVLARARGLWREGRLVPSPCLAAFGACQRAEPRVRHPVRRGYQDGHLRPGAFQRLAALAGGGGWIVIGLGAISALFGIAFALAQNDLKRLLAYCSVENIGILLVGLGAALLGVAHGDAPWGRLALAGALLHVWNHGAFKALLFFGAGSVMHATGTREMSRLGGLWRAMPWTASLFALGTLAVSGLPPLNGFVSEWLVYLGLFEAATQRGATVWAALPAVMMLAIAGAMALACFVKAAAVVFLGASRTHAAAHAHECGPLMRGPMLALAGVCVMIGLAPVLFWPAVSRAVGTWNPAWTTADASAPLATLGTVNIALTFLAGAAGIWLWRKARVNGLRRALTWDCGYAGPTARMQYTSGSFGGITAGWFGWLLRPELRLRRPRGPLPAKSGLTSSASPKPFLNAC